MRIIMGFRDVLSSLFSSNNQPLFENGTDYPTQFRSKYSASPEDVDGAEFCVGVCAPSRGGVVTSSVYIPISASRNLANAINASSHQLAVITEANLVNHQIDAQNKHVDFVFDSPHQIEASSLFEAVGSQYAIVDKQTIRLK